MWHNNKGRGEFSVLVFNHAKPLRFAQKRSQNRFVLDNKTAKAFLTDTIHVFSIEHTV